MSQTQVVAVLDRARDYVEQGWAQGNGRVVRDGVIHRCVGQAITDAWVDLVQQGNPKPSIEDQAVFQQASHLFTEVTGGPPSIPYWNDKIAQSQGQVLVTFDRAIAAAKESAPEVTEPVAKIKVLYTYCVPETSETPMTVMQKVKELVGA